MPPSSAAIWRQLSVDDIPDLVKVADEVHPELPECADVFTERCRLFPQGCLALVVADGSEHGGELCGYAISHPIRRNHPPRLDSLLGTIGPEADQYYIHDLAILPSQRGKGAAAEGVGRLLQVAARFPTTCLISVYGTWPFWTRFGFAAEPVDADLSQKLREYGDDATFLTRRRDL
jgi:GNAT superfamily N-acetyltransferase